MNRFEQIASELSVIYCSEFSDDVKTKFTIQRYKGNEISSAKTTPPKMKNNHMIPFGTQLEACEE